jgi:flagellar biosynthesis protein FlhF
MKMFAAESFDAAKALIFAEMGDDAIILSEREVEGGVEVRAAIDKSARMNDDPMFLSLDDKRPNAFMRENPLRQRVRDSLLWHGAPTSFAERVAESAMMEAEQGTLPEQALALGLGVFGKFDPLPAMPDTNLILVGPPGHGRTSVAAKLTRRAALTNGRLLPVAADLDGTAGGAQLAAYLELEKDNIRSAGTPEVLFKMLSDIKRSGDRCVIDLPSINPFDAEDMVTLKGLISTVDAEPILVMSAEGHPDDLAEAAKSFGKAGIKRAILTKLDVVRRRGGAVAALSNAGVAFSHLAVTPFIGGGLIPAAPGRLSSLLLEDAKAHVAIRGAA